MLGASRTQSVCLPVPSLGFSKDTEHQGVTGYLVLRGINNILHLLHHFKIFTSIIL